LVSGRAQGGGVEPQWLMKPLTDLANRVQYPLATPSKLGSARRYPKLARAGRREALTGKFHFVRGLGIPDLAILRDTVSSPGDFS
jgi:hypothetical protein